MSREETKHLGLFSEQELDGIQPSGSPWVISEDDPATVPVPLQTVIVKVDGPYTERDRKLWVFLLHTVFDELGEKPIHSLPIREVNAIFRELGGEHDTKWIWDSAKRLAKTTVEWETTFDDGRFEQGISSMFGANISKKARQMGTLTFNFPPLLIPIIKQPTRFARLRVHFLLKLSGKYAVTLYEILEGFANRRDGRCVVTIADLRTWLKVPDKTYPTWKNFRLRVLHPAIKQINDDPYGAGFSVEYTPIRKGRFYHEIVFQLTKTAKRIQTDRLIQTNAGNTKKIREAKAKQRPALLDGDIDRVAQNTGYALDMADMERQFWAHWENKGKPDFTKGVAVAFKGFVDRKYRQMKQIRR
jgi:hypothetical protein